MRAYIAACLHERARVSSSAAFELALYYKIGFGVPKDDSRSDILLGQSMRSSQELQDRIESIKRTELYLEFNFKSPLRTHTHCFTIGGIARYYNDQPLSDMAELEHRRELADMEKALGVDSPPVLALRDVLVGVLIAKRKMKEARDLRSQGRQKRDAMPILEQNSTPTRGRWEYIGFFEQQIQLKDPEKLNERSLKDDLKRFPEGHPDILDKMVQLANIHKAHSNWREAEAIEEQMLVIARRDLGQEHPWTLLIMYCLAATYIQQHRWNDAEKLFLRVIKMNQEILGEEHEQTLTSLRNLAVVYEHQERWKEAIKLHEQGMQVSRRVLGQEHHDTLVSMAFLADGYKREGRLKEAEELELQVTKIRSENLGWSHPDTLGSMEHLACTYREQGRWKEAVRLEVQAKVHQIRATCMSKLLQLRMLWWSRPWWCRWSEIWRVFHSRTKSAQKITSTGTGEDMISPVTITTRVDGGHSGWTRVITRFING